jgi:hypothetical protein
VSSPDHVAVTSGKGPTVNEQEVYTPFQGNIFTVAALLSHRVKPDIVAPGLHIVSGRSDGDSTECKAKWEDTAALKLDGRWRHQGARHHHTITFDDGLRLEDNRPRGSGYWHGTFSPSGGDCINAIIGSWTDSACTNTNAYACATKYTVSEASTALAWLTRDGRWRQQGARHHHTITYDDGLRLEDNRQRGSGYWHGTFSSSGGDCVNANIGS